MSDNFDYDGTYKRKHFMGKTAQEVLRDIAIWMDKDSGDKYGHSNDFYVIDISGYDYSSEFGDYHMDVTYGAIHE